MTIRVLIAEPDWALLATYQARLVREGIYVATARNGLDCLAELHRFEPDVLVLEPEMPSDGGEGVLEVMHDVYELPLVPVFIITSRENLARLDAKKFMSEFPLVTHIQAKPVGPDELVRLIRHIADEPRPREDDIRKPIPHARTLGRLVGKNVGRSVAASAPLVGGRP